MRIFSCVAICVVVAAGCSRDRRFDIEGQVLAVDQARQLLTLKHGDIKGFMPGMTMPFTVEDRRALSERRPGELIKATLVVTENAGRLENIVRTGEAPLPPEALTEAPRVVLTPGDPVPDAAFTDQQGHSRRLSEWRGRTIAVTFIYTRCPLPDFCPLMDRNFAVVQRRLLDRGELAAKVHLLSVTFDPQHDTPDVLRAHAQKVGSNDAVWTWLTGNPSEIDRFASSLGMSILRGDQPLAEITHNLRTVVLDGEGRVQQVFNGNEWKPEDLLAVLGEPNASNAR
jgi:protein SCO1